MSLPRIRWSWAVDWLLLPLGAWLAVGILALFCWHCVGCTSAGVRSGTTETHAPETTATHTHMEITPPCSPASKP